MILTGQNFIGAERSGLGPTTFRAENPSNKEIFGPDYSEATNDEIRLAIEKSELAFKSYRLKTGSEKADFLEAIAAEILALGDVLVKRCCAESGLPKGRITGERGRTMNQLKLFASLLREGSWVDARIDVANPDRQPFPKVDIRSMQKAIGPVGIFGASNFPLAFSVAGGDTASALAAGCTIVVKAHPAHPGTCELIAHAINKAIEKTGMPEGTFSMVQGPSVEVGMGIVTHPLIKAIGFTGSYRGGKAIFDAASKREEPIPVYAEMGSTNPVFILPKAMADRGADIAKGLAASATLGVGQFCTNPGLVIHEGREVGNKFVKSVSESFENIDAGTMLTGSIHKAFKEGIQSKENTQGVQLLSTGKSKEGGYHGTPSLLTVTSAEFQKHHEEEIFGPSTLLVKIESEEEFTTIARQLSGHLTATLFAAPEELIEYQELINILERKVGRLIVNGFPTGVEVCHSMVHGGPFPATTNAGSSSVGTMAITRFTRPVCYQNFPDELLPEELQNSNPLGIKRYEV